jgi:pimeloyl-ACP methyl ester carboxylesterase
MTASEGAWTQIELAGHHPCDVFEPARRNDRGFAVIYLHGVRLTRLADNEAFTREFARHGLPVIAPRTGPCWWTDRICPEFDPRLTPERHVLDNVMPFVESRWNAAPPRVALLGTSMGGQGALRLAFKHAARFPVVAAISPAIDYQIRWDEGDEVLAQMYSDREAVRQDTATLHVHPLNWPRNIWFSSDPEDTRWHESADRLRMKLAALGIPHEHDLKTTGGGHGFVYYDRMARQAMGFIAERLDREDRRVT